MAPSPNPGVIIRLNPRVILRCACATIAVLALVSVLDDLLSPSTSNVYWRVASLESERSLATAYAVLQLAGCAAAAFVAGYALRRGDRPWARHWYAAGVLLAFVAADEHIGLHESVSEEMHDRWDTGGILRYPWVLPAVVVVVVLVVVFLPFVRALPRPVRTLVFAAAVVYLVGAVGFEVIGGLVDDDTKDLTTAFIVATTTEETLELVGVALMGYAVTRYLAEFVEPVSLTTAERVSTAASDPSPAPTHDGSGTST